MTTRAILVAAGRTLIGTPYHSHARLPGIGIDCIGVPIVSSWIAGVKPRTFDFQGYSPIPDGSLMPMCKVHMVEIRREEMQPGDVIVLRFGANPHHVALLAPYRHGDNMLSIIHAENYRHNKVVEHRLWLDGAMQYVAAFRIPEVKT